MLRAAVDRASSEAERILVGLLRKAGITGWQCGYGVDGYQVDVAFPEARLAIEVDGWARFTWHDLTHRADDVCGMIANFVSTRPNPELYSQSR